MEEPRTISIVTMLSRMKSKVMLAKNIEVVAVRAVRTDDGRRGALEGGAVGLGIDHTGGVALVGGLGDVRGAIREEGGNFEGVDLRIGLEESLRTSRAGLSFKSLRGGTRGLGGILAVAVVQLH